MARGRKKSVAKNEIATAFADAIVESSKPEVVIPGSQPQLLARGVRFERLSQDPVAVIRCEPEALGAALADIPRGAFVKFSPLVDGIGRATLDRRGLRKMILDAGARAAIVAPEVVRSDAPAAATDAPNPRVGAVEAIEGWFSRQRGIEDEVLRIARDAAIAAALGAGL